MRVMRESAVALEIKITAMDCANCGMVFGVTDEFSRHRRQDGGRFYCPNGHGNAFGETETDKVRKELDATRRREELVQESYKRETTKRQAAERSLAATRGQVTQLRKRAQAGVCPYGCRRHFADVEWHVATKHAGQGLPGETEARDGD